MNKTYLDTLLQEHHSPKKILHIGANFGQEVAFYASHGIAAWHIEAVPAAYEQLALRCDAYTNQHALNVCVSDSAGRLVSFNVSSNGYQSSSLLPLGRHSVAYPHIQYHEHLQLRTSTVDELVANGQIPSDVDFVVIDVQGAELMVLQGATELLKRDLLLGCQIETAVVPLYSGGADYLGISTFLKSYGFYLKTCDFNSQGWTDALFMKPYWSQGLSPEEIKTLNVLRPKPSPKPLVRIGGEQDGAYLLPDDLKDIKACFSPGVNNRKSFEDELVDIQGIECHMCDFSSDIDKFMTPLKPLQTFKKKWLEPEAANNAHSLEEWVNDLAPNPNDDLILQMDIEGAEYRNLLTTPESVLKRFRIIILELHWMSVVNQPSEFQKQLGPLLSRLDTCFICVHAHPNNCGGEFDVAGSELNMPHVLEVTFLRRDRWNTTPIGNCFEPLIPHPLDITRNMLTKPPIFLNEHWLDNGKRRPESTIKMLEDQILHLSDSLRKLESESPDSGGYLLSMADMHRLACNLASQLPESSPSQFSSSAVIDLAEGKPFALSSRHASSPQLDAVTERSPYFFHTLRGRNEFITIDLLEKYSLFELLIWNRTDTCKDRARFLYYCLHEAPKPNLLYGIPIELSHEFIGQEAKPSRTDLRGVASRYLTIFSPVETFLHFSKIKIIGLG